MEDISGWTIKEMVNHPEHYKGNKFEVIDIIEDYDLGFCMGNAIKYLLRAGKKDDEIQDLNKALWYVQRRIREVDTAKQIARIELADKEIDNE